MLFVPNLRYRLISVSLAKRNRYQIALGSKNREIQTGERKLIHNAFNEVRVIWIAFGDELFELSIKAGNNSFNIFKNRKQRPWHEIQGQFGENILEDLIAHIIGATAEE